MRPTKMSPTKPGTPGRGRLLLPAATVAATLAACAAPAPFPSPPPGAPAPQGGAPNAPGYPPPATPAPAPPPKQPGAPPPRQFHMGAAATALVGQAQNQARAGNYAQASVTLERALRIEPDNPLVWIEYGRVELGAGDAAQADGMGRKALQLATGDPSAQASAWHLIADSLRARGNNELAAEAEQHAASFSTR
ncbi:MAG: tetratricopeptide repeat protein [Steroidobacteraceae bacterium]